MSRKSPVRRKASASVYHLRIELLHISPIIRRQVLVPGTLTLADLDHVIQAAMGWTNSHLHDFKIGDVRYGLPDPDWPEGDLQDERRHTVADVLGETVSEFVYSYDFGDGWEHAVGVEERLPAIEGRNTRPMCIGGENACPPEDVGGPWGYGEFLEALNDPAHPMHDDMWSWWGGPFDPKGFNLNEANKAIWKRF